MLEMSSGRVDVVVNALVLGLTAIAKNPNLGTYKILQTPAVAIPSSMEVFAFLFLTAVLMPALAVATVGSYGLTVWIYQMVAGPPGPPAR